MIHDTRGPLVGLAPVTALLAAQVDELEGARIAMSNRARLLTTPADKPDADGLCRGLGLPADHPDVLRVTELLHGRPHKVWADLPDGSRARIEITSPGLADLEKRAITQLERAVRDSPWGPFLDSAPGVGAKTLARLLASIGDPRWNDMKDRPRTIFELRAYCGLHVLDDGTAPSRRRGLQANWDDVARKRLWIIAGTCVKYVAAPSRYRDTYLASREKVADAVHTADCRRCGPAGKPALAGTPLPPAHQHARAVRKVMSHVLTDVWLHARRLRGETVTVEPPAPGKREAA